ncbi:hypothetical protein ACGFX4_32220 [Kitasatospora sp. NPDC048365]|uniref:hypothetical protein n=1 Tax=Kitasatospora sp. NPDC048365 TaxID=3364050 RepID=UPI00371E56DB
MVVDAFEEEFAKALRNSAELAPDPPGEMLARVAEARGQARRGRRRAASVAGAGVLGVALLASAGHLGLPFPGGDGDKVKPGGPRGRITGTYMSQTLRALLPAGGISDEQGYGIGQMAMPDMGPTAWLQFDDGQGSVQVNLSTDRVDLPIGADTRGTRCEDPYDTPIESCDRTVRPDGSIVVVTKQLPRPPADERIWIAVYTGTDGRQVRLSERDYQQNGTSSGRTQMPLTPEQLTSVITSSTWDPLFEDFRRGATGRPAAPEPVGAAPKDLLATLRQLLPNGVTPGEPGPQDTPDRAHLPVTVADRTGSLVVQIQPKWANTEKKRSSFGTESGQQDLVRAADGTVSVIRLTGTSKGQPEPVQYWEAEVLRPDGTLVTLAQVNSATWYGAKPGTPVLTIEQLRAIALDPTWVR